MFLFPEYDFCLAGNLVWLEGLARAGRANDEDTLVPGVRLRDKNEDVLAPGFSRAGSTLELWVQLVPPSILPPPRFPLN